jgi:predicted HTH domain antitoxin
LGGAIWEHAVSISFELPSEVEQHLQVALGDLGLAAKQSLLMDAYRLGQISIGGLAKTLGMGVIEAQQWLTDQGVPQNYGLEAFQADVRTIERLFPKE